MTGPLALSGIKRAVSNERSMGSAARTAVLTTPDASEVKLVLAVDVKAGVGDRQVKLW